ncbi:unnamed protein product [Rhodiola kirilowii]
MLALTVSSRSLLLCLALSAALLYPSSAEKEYVLKLDNSNFFDVMWPDIFDLLSYSSKLSLPP